MGSTQSQAALVIALGHSVQAGFADRDDGGQNHDAQQQAGSKQAHALAAFHVQHSFEKVRFDHSLHRRDHNDHAEEAVHDRGDTGQQLYRRQQHLVDTGRCKTGHIDGRQQPNGHPHNDRACGDIDAPQDHGQDAVQVVAGFPGGAKQELEGADLKNGGQAVCK